MVNGNLTGSYLISSLVNHPDFTFYLTGSRFFNHAHSGSDWDFFAQDTFKLRGFLHQEGYKPLPHYDGNETDDLNTAVVFRRHEYRYADEQLIYSHVDIQLQKDVDLKVVAQNILNAHFGRALRHIPKEQRKNLWNMAFQTARLSKQDNPFPSTTQAESRMNRIW
jgi:hypothetical protein